MQGINKLCEILANYICEEIKCDENKRQVIAYGVFALIQMLICIFLVVITGYIFNVVIEALIISFGISILRKSSGGAHASTPEKCAIFGTVISVVMALISKYINLGFKEYLIIIGLTFVYGYYFVIKLSPVDSKAKPIRSESKRKKLKKASILILSSYLVVIFINTVIYFLTLNEIFIRYSICICMGIFWQVLSLTKVGHVILNKLH